MLLRPDSPLLAALAATAIFAVIAWGLGLWPAETPEAGARGEPEAPSCAGRIIARTPPRETTW